MILNKELVLGKVPYHGYHLMLFQHSETFQVRILDERNNVVQLKLSPHATEADALDEAKQKVDSIVGQCRL
jgi:hypothetical protein